jgi:CBS domain-containing protein
MTDNELGRDVLRSAPLLRHDDTVEVAVKSVLDSRLPALPVLDGHDRLAGIFGEREFMGALFPGYLKELSYAGFIPNTLDDAIERQSACRVEPVANYMNTEHIDVGTNFSDAQVAEVFIHHRVLIVPVIESGRVVGVITRADFFRRIAERFLEPG